MTVTTTTRRYKKPSPVGCIRLGARRWLHLFIRGDIHLHFRDTEDHDLFFLQKPIPILNEEGIAIGCAISRYNGFFMELLEHGGFFSPLRQVKAVYTGGRGHADVFELVPEGSE